MTKRPSPWALRIMLAAAAIVSVLVLMRGLTGDKSAEYDAVETRGVTLQRLPSASEQLDVDQEEQVSSLDLLPKVSLREANPLPPDPPAAPAPPPVEKPVPEPTPEPYVQQSPVEEKKPFYRPPLQRRGLPKSRTSNATSGAFVQSAPDAQPQADQGSGSSSGLGSGKTDRPRTFRDRTGRATIRN